MAPCASSVFLGESRPMRTFWAKPRKSITAVLPYWRRCAALFAPLRGSLVAPAAPLES